MTEDKELATGIHTLTHTHNMIVSHRSLPSIINHLSASITHFYYQASFIKSNHFLPQKQNFIFSGKLGTDIVYIFWSILEIFVTHLPGLKIFEWILSDP